MYCVPSCVYQTNIILRMDFRFPLNVIDPDPPQLDFMFLAETWPFLLCLKIYLSINTGEGGGGTHDSGLSSSSAQSKQNKSIWT